MTPLSAAPSAPPPHCRPTGHHSNVPCRPPHQPHRPTVGRLVITPTYPVGRLVITPTYPVGHPISPATPLSADWSSLQHTLSAAPSTPPPHCWPTGHHSDHTVSRLVITQTILSADWSSLQCTLLAAPSAPPPHCRPTGHHSNIPCRPTGLHLNSPLQHTLSAAPLAHQPQCRPTRY